MEIRDTCSVCHQIICCCEPEQPSDDGLDELAALEREGYADEEPEDDPRTAEDLARVIGGFPRSSHLNGGRR